MLRWFEPRVAGEGEHFFWISLDSRLFDRLAKNPPTWWKELMKICTPDIDRAIVELKIRVDDLPRPKHVPLVRLNRLTEQRNALKEVDDDDDNVLVTSDFAKFLYGEDYWMNGHYVYTLLPE